MQGWNFKLLFNHFYILYYTRYFEKSQSKNEKMLKYFIKNRQTAILCIYRNVFLNFLLDNSLLLC